MAKGMFWSVAGAVISRALLLVASIVIARILGRDVYGEFGIIRSTVEMFLIFAGFSLGMTAVKYVAEYKEVDPDRTGRIIAFSILFAGVTGLLVMIGILIFAPLIASNSINAPHLAGELRIGAVILFINALNGALIGALTGFEAFKAIAKVNLQAGLISFPLFIGGVYYFGLQGAVWALAASMAVNLLLNHLALRDKTAQYSIPFSFKGCLKEKGILWSFSIPATLSGIMVSPVLWICNALLVNQPDGYGQMGIFNAVNQWRAAILFVPGMISQIVLPMLTNLNSSKDVHIYWKFFKYNIVINSVVALLVALPISGLSKVIMRTYGAGFEDGKWVLILITFSTVLIAVNNVIGQLIASKGKMWIGFFLNSLWAIVFLILSFSLISRGLGAVGLALAHLGAYLFHSVSQTIFVFVMYKRETR